MITIVKFIVSLGLCLKDPAVSGRRDLALLSLMYDTGARVKEIINLTPSMVRFDKPYTIKLIGKGNKARIVPFMDPVVGNLKKDMEE